MKKLCFIALTTVFLLLCTHSTQAQTTEPIFNQVELMKQFLGSWRIDLTEGTYMMWEITPFGTAMIGNTKFVTKDTIFDSNKYLWGYDKKNDKILLAEIFNDTPDMEIDVLWFTSENMMDGVLQKDIDNPENAVIKFKFEFKSPDLLVLKYLKNNIVATELTMNREKK
jgi:hypothetical protein